MGVKAPSEAKETLGYAVEAIRVVAGSKPLNLNLKRHVSGGCLGSGSHSCTCDIIDARG